MQDTVITDEGEPPALPESDQGRVRVAAYLVDLLSVTFVQYYRTPTRYILRYDGPGTMHIVESRSSYTDATLRLLRSCVPYFGQAIVDEAIAWVLYGDDRAPPQPGSPALSRQQYEYIYRCVQQDATDQNRWLTVHDSLFPSIAAALRNDLDLVDTEFRLTRVGRTSHVDTLNINGVVEHRLSHPVMAYAIMTTLIGFSGGINDVPLIARWFRFLNAVGDGRYPWSPVVLGHEQAKPRNKRPCTYPSGIEVVLAELRRLAPDAVLDTSEPSVSATTPMKITVTSYGNSLTEAVSTFVALWIRYTRADPGLIVDWNNWLFGRTGRPSNNGR